MADFFYNTDEEDIKKAIKLTLKIKLLNQCLKPVCAMVCLLHMTKGCMKF